MLNNAAGWIWDFTIKPMASPFPEGSFGGLISYHQVGMIAVVLLMLVLLFLFFRFTSVGLAMRAAAQNPESARLCGISEIGRAHVCTPVTNAHLVCRLLLEKKT